MDAMRPSVSVCSFARTHSSASVLPRARGVILDREDRPVLQRSTSGAEWSPHAKQRVSRQVKD